MVPEEHSVPRIDDPEIQQIYYYRWKLYRAHIREIGAQGTDETEFLPDVPWARHPYTDLNDSSSFHILEGRWLRDPRYVQSLVDHLYAGGGNDRHFSESIAAATYAWTEVTGNPAPALRHLDAMEHVYNLWDDHFDAGRNLYWIEPIADATEYTISSIDASGAGFTNHPFKRDAENGFLGGFAFRPSINAYQFANAEAIAHLADEAHQSTVAAEYRGRAERIRAAVLQQLWNPQLQHFTDIYQRSTPFVTAGTFIRGRELVGYTPWMFGLVPTYGATQPYSAAWQHALNTSQLAGPFGLRTNEPTYAKYMVQYRYDHATGLPECQWNGPSWPFQTSQTLTAMANTLGSNGASVAPVTRDDFVHLLRQSTQQHFLSPGHPDLEEDYNPDTGRPIVGLPRSHHYNHSTYVDVVLTGLLGIRPQADDAIEIDPLLPTVAGRERPIHYFALQHLAYHGHNLTIVYDDTGSRYHAGAGLSLFSDGLRIAGPAPLGRMSVRLPHRTPKPLPLLPVDVAVNVWARPPSQFETQLPIASASDASDDAHLYEAIDGRAWFFPEIANGWSPALNTGSTNPIWYAVDLRTPRRVFAAEADFFEGGQSFSAPQSWRLQALQNGTWNDVAAPQLPAGAEPVNGPRQIAFAPIMAQHFRILMTPAPGRRVRLIEWKLLSASQ